MFRNPSIQAFTIICACSAMIAVPAMNELDAAVTICPSGHSAARLTGWPLNEKYPRGTAEYNEATKVLEVAVESVALPDGKVLTVMLGEDRIGQLSPLADGQAMGTVTRQLPDGGRIRVFDGDRPIVSANLECVAAALPSPTPTPTATPSPTPTLTPSPNPTAEPTQDPMPKRTPAPTPSPSN